MSTLRFLIIPLLFLSSLTGFAQVADSVTYEHRIYVNGACGMCQERIETAALQLMGVEGASWDMNTHILTVQTNDEEFNPDHLHWAMTGAGHDTDLYKASKEVYEGLHACCQYRDTETKDSFHEDHDTPDPVSGLVFEKTASGEPLPLTGVNIYWLGSTTGTTTDIDGRFELAPSESTNLLVTSYVGFPSDTIDMQAEKYVEIILDGAITLDNVEVTHRRKATEVSFLKPMKVTQMNERELHKAACCNLSESFETNPSIDVSFTDAVTGTRQIEMLGLAGPYVQISRELIPEVRGLSAISGLTYIPGSWVQSIQLSKGPGSVTNGFESMTGQINVELKKPEESERLYLNLYANEGGRLEANLNTRHSFSEKVHTGLLLHGSSRRVEHDRNEDSFLDNPLGENWILLNRWRFQDFNGWEGQFGVKGTFVDTRSGQKDFNESTDRGTMNHWGAGINTRRLDAWAKTGRVFPNKPTSSMGMQLSTTYHDQKSFFGLRSHNALQKSVYFNLLFQGQLGSAKHQYMTGASFSWDNYEEEFQETTFNRDEKIPGAFFEYTYLPTEQMTIVAGLRGDYHNNYGGFLSPRLHLRYAFAEESVLRASFGRGQRTASILAENMGAMASERAFIIQGENNDNPYGLNQEVSWSYGLNLTQSLKFFQKEFVLGLDAYHTRFSKQIVVDYDQNPQAIYFYNLEGDSWSTSLQAQVDVELLERFDVRMAYRFNDVKTTYANGVLQKPLVARHRAFINMGYATTDDWKFDFTLNWQGSKRIQNTQSNPEEFQLEERSPDFLQVNTHISKGWKKKWEVYVGVENLLDFVQESPILSAEDPFSGFFDSSMVWGPVFGRNIYVGMRYKIH